MVCTSAWCDENVINYGTKEQDEGHADIIHPAQTFILCTKVTLNFPISLCYGRSARHGRRYTPDNKQMYTE